MFVDNLSYTIWACNLMKQKRTFFLLGSLIASLVIVFSISSWLSTKSSVEPTGPKTEPILVASENLAEGAIVLVAKMTWQEWNIADIKPDYIVKKNNEQINTVDGGVVRTPIFKGEPILASKVIATHGKSAISAIIKEGMRAVTVPYAKLANAPSLIAPGDVVDVIIPKRTQGTNEDYFGQTILAGIRVLAVNDELQKMGNEEATSSNAKTITLEVTATQAEDLAGAIRDGQVVISMQSIFAGTTKSSPAKPTPKAEIPTPSKVITIMRGSEKKDMTFNNVGKP